MKSKTKRLLAIKKLIRENKVRNQEELLGKLNAEGFTATQATLSRDLKFLRVARIPDHEAGYVYILPEQDIREGPGDYMDADIPVSGYRSMIFARNMCLIKTLPGYASSIAAAIDRLNTYEIVGTVAGDDTILLIPRDGVNKSDIINALTLLIPQMQNI